MLFSINHILDDISINPYQKKQSAIAGLKEGERLPGGRAAIYLANNMFRLDDIKKLKPTEGLGIDGSVVDVTIVKSRSNKTMKSVPMIFNKTEGMFDNELSLYWLLKEEGRIGGAGVSMYLSSCPSIKFAQKNFKTVLHESTELQQAFAKECYDLLSTFLSDMVVERYEESDQPKFNINDMILGLNPSFA